MSIVILPICVVLYSIIYFVQFYYGFAGSEPLYKVITTEAVRFGTTATPLTFKCQVRANAFVISIPRERDPPRRGTVARRCAATPRFAPFGGGAAAAASHLVPPPSPLSLPQNPNGCLFRVPTGGVSMCTAGVNSGTTETSDQCSAASGRRRALLETDHAQVRSIHWSPYDRVRVVDAVS